MIVAELRVVPVGKDSSMEKTVDAVCGALEDCGVKYEVGPVATTFETQSVQNMFETVQYAHEAALETAPRVLLSLTIDQRQDRPEDMESLRNVSGSARREASPSGAARPSARPPRRARAAAP